MKKKLVIILMLFVTMVIFSCTKTSEPETKGNISGTILDSKTSQPISGALITTDPITFSKTTDSQGAYLIEKVEPGIYTVQASRIGYITNTTTVNVVVGQTATGDVHLTEVSPSLSVSTTELNYGTTTTSLPFTISNSGSGTTLNYTITIPDSANWININPSQLSGSITTEQLPIIVSVQRSGLDAGDYSDVISIDSNGGDAHITVDMTAQGPVLQGQALRSFHLSSHR